MRLLSLTPILIFLVAFNAFAGLKEGKKAEKEKDFVRAFKEYSVAAEGGDPEAQFNLSILYYHGRGVPIDMKRYVEWLQKSANLGYADAEVNLGLAFMEGKGVPQDNKLALMWFNKAVAQGDIEANIAIAWMYYEGLGVPKDLKEAFRWNKLAADRDSLQAQKNIASMYAHGEGTDRSMVKAAEWYQKASAQGDPVAQVKLAELYKTGEGVAQNVAKAYEYYKKAAIQNDRLALYEIGLMYEEGLNGTQDDSLSYVFYSLSVAAENSEALVARERLRYKLSSNQLQEAQNIASHWKSGNPLPSKTQSSMQKITSWFEKKVSPSGKPSPSTLPKPQVALAAKASPEMTEEEWTQGVMKICDTLGDGTELYRFCQNPVAEGVSIEKTRCVCSLFDRPRTAFCKQAMRGVYASCSANSNPKEAKDCLGRTVAANMEQIWKDKVTECSASR